MYRLFDALLPSTLRSAVGSLTSTGGALQQTIAGSFVQLQTSTMTVAAADTALPESTTAAAAAGGLHSSPGHQAPYTTPEALDAHVERAWAHFRGLGSPKWHVAPMVDQSELPFRMLCRAHGAQAAYTPMLHARLFLEHAHYRSEHFTTCPGDRPLFVQFCANDPEVFVAAAAIVQDQTDYIDLNLGCPQRIAKRGYYGAFLMDNLELVRQLVSAAANRLHTPVSVKIRLFPQLQDTIAYATMLQEAGASLLAIHGRTREMKDHAAHRADWEAIAAVRRALRIPVLANGDVRCLDEARALMEATGADGVMSAEPLLLNPMLFDAVQHPQDAVSIAPIEGLRMCEEYLQWCEKHPSHPRMVRGHVHKLITGFLAEHTDIRARMHTLGNNISWEEATQKLQQLVAELRGLVAASGRDYPIPKLPERKLKALEREAAKAAAIAEQEREAAALAEIGAAQGDTAAAAGAAAGAGAAGEQQQGLHGGPQPAAVVAAAAVVQQQEDADGRAAKRLAVDSSAGS